MASVKVALPGFRVPIGRTGKGELIYLEGPWREFFSGLHLRTGGDTVDKVEVAATAGTAATASAVAAQAAADDAQAAADSVADDVSGVSALQALQLSGVSSNCTIVGSDAGSDGEIAISAHTRYYADGTSVAVNSGSNDNLAYDTQYWIYYDDAARAGGAVTYAFVDVEEAAKATTTTPNRHYVGSCRTPVALDPDIDGVPNFYAP